jgi:hypothetical protein
MRLTNFMIEPELSEGLKLIKERDGISEGEQIRRGIRLWLDSKGVKVKKAADRPRAKRGRKA